MPKFRLMEGTHVEQVGWRLSDGRVVEQLPKGPDGRMVEGEPVVERYQVQTGPKGVIVHQPIIETKHDLHTKFDINPDYPPKFVRVADDYVEVPPLVADATLAVEALSPAEIAAFRAQLRGQGVVQAAVPPPGSGGNTAVVMPPQPQMGGRTIEAMNFDEIKKWADEEEIDLKGVKSKEEAIRKLKASGVIK